MVHRAKVCEKREEARSRIMLVVMELLGITRQFGKIKVSIEFAA